MFEWSEAKRLRILRERELDFRDAVQISMEGRSYTCDHFAITSPASFRPRVRQPLRHTHARRAKRHLAPNRLSHRAPDLATVGRGRLSKHAPHPRKLPRSLQLNGPPADHTQ